MTKVPYLQERQNAAKEAYWAVNPPRYVKEAIGAKYETFQDKEEAISHALAVNTAFHDSRRKAEGQIYVVSDSVEGLINHYQTTDAFKDLSHNSKKAYRLFFRNSVEISLGSSNKPFGEVFGRNVTTEMVDRFYSEMIELRGRHRANSCMKVMKIVFNVAVRHGRVRSNPFLHSKIKGTRSRIVVWEPSEVEKFVATADAMDRESVGTLALLCYELCQRPGDMRQLRWRDFSDEIFTFYQEKTMRWQEEPTPMELEVTPRLEERFKRFHNRPKDDFIVVDEDTGKPYDRYKYAKITRQIRKAAGLRSELTIGDLRRTGATEMAEAECTEDELRAVTGHKSRNILNTYVRPTRRMARSGMNKRFKK